MRIIKYKAISDFAEKHPDAKVALDDWYAKAERCEWSCFADVKKTFNSVDAVGGKRHVFNIRGNLYRLVALILFTPKLIYIRFIGTHAEYNNIKDCSKI